MSDNPLVVAIGKAFTSMYTQACERRRKLNTLLADTEDIVRNLVYAESARYTAAFFEPSLILAGAFIPPVSILNDVPELQKAEVDLSNEVPLVAPRFKQLHGMRAMARRAYRQRLLFRVETRYQRSILRPVDIDRELIEGGK